MDITLPGLSVTEAKRIEGSLVYGLSGSDGVIFYVGQTKNPESRFQEHASARTENLRLHLRLSDIKGKLRIHILEYNPPNLHEAERRHIEAHSGLLNIIGADHWTWSAVPKQQKPWVAGVGVLCPSAIALKKTRAEWKPIIKASIAKMDDATRCNFEVGLYRDFPVHMQKRLNRWLDATQDKMIDCLEKSMVCYG